MKFRRDQQILMMLHQCVVDFAVRGSFDSLRLNRCFTVDTAEGQTSNGRHATGLRSIYLVEQNLIGNALDLPSQAGDSSNIL